MGTNDVDHDAGPDCVRISSEEAAYLQGAVTRLFPHAAGVRPVAAFSALRPLVRDESGSPAATSGEHRIWAPGAMFCRPGTAH